METIKKYNIGYILSYIFIPAIIIAICVILNVIFDWRGSLAVITLFFIPMIGVLRVHFYINKRRIKCLLF